MKLILLSVIFFCSVHINAQKLEIIKNVKHKVIEDYYQSGGNNFFVENDENIFKVETFKEVCISGNQFFMIKLWFIDSVIIKQFIVDSLFSKDDRWAYQKFEILAEKNKADSIYGIVLKKLLKGKDIFSIINYNAFRHNMVPGACEYIVLYSTQEGKYYRLKGFMANDFFLFVNNLFPEYFIRSNKDKVHILKSKLKKKVSEMGNETDINFELLFDIYFGKRKKNKNNYECIPCYLRDNIKCTSIIPNK